MLKINRTFIPWDAELKNYLTTAMKGYVLPAYTTVYDKYANTEFSRNKEKYLKYDKNKLEVALSSIFDRVA